MLDSVEVVGAAGLGSLEMADCIREAKSMVVVIWMLSAERLRFCSVQMDIDLGAKTS